MFSEFLLLIVGRGVVICTQDTVHVEVLRQLVGDSSLSPSCEPQESESRWELGGGKAHL